MFQGKGREADRNSSPAKKTLYTLFQESKHQVINSLENKEEVLL